MPSTFRRFALTLALAPSLALAQAYVPSESTEPYAPVDAEEGTTLVTDGDDAFREATLPFAFRLYGRAYQKVWVSVNGGVSFVGTDDVTGQVYPLPGVNAALPSPARPQGIVAAVWDDWVASPLAPEGGSRVAFAVRTLEGGKRVAVVDWRRVQPFAAAGASGPAYSFQLLLYEGSDRYEVRFGERVGPAGAVSATSGSENQSGTAGLTHLACSPACGDADVTARPGIVISPNLNAELVTTLTLDGAQDGGPTALLRVSNTGPSAAPGVRVRLHRSADGVLDAADPVVLELEPFDLGARPAEVLLPVTVPLDAQLRGSWRLIAVADPDDTIAELDKANNVSVTAPFLAGPELSASVGGPGLRVVGEPVTFALQLANAGVQDAEGVRFRLVISGPLLDAPLEIHRSGPMTLAALSSVALPPLDVTLPDTLYGGSYVVNVEVDPAGAVTENDETNNAGPVPVALQLQGPDVGIVSVAAGATSVAQGLAVPVRVVLENRGGARATNFTFSVYLSDNDVVTLRDRRVFTSQPISLEGRATRTVLQTASIPADTPVGTWSVGVIVDAEGTVRELDRSNNVRRAEGLLAVVKPAADFAVTNAQVEPRGVAGETVRVSALVTNVGAAPVDGLVSVVFSANATPSVRDLRLVDARVALAPGGQQVLAVDAPIPSTLAAGSWTVGVIADPDGAIDEASEANNVAVAPAPVVLEAASFVVSTPWLPDALAGAPYDVTLATSGGTTPATWRLAAGALPEGLSFTSAGRLSGTPLAPGLHALTVEATSAGTRAVAAFTLSVRASAPSLGLVDRRLPPARRGVSYVQDIGAEGGTPPYSFRLDGAAPAGLSLSASGTVSGFPVEAGTFELAVVVEDATRNVARGLVELGVHAEGAVSLVTSRLREPEAGRAYAMPLVVEGGRPPYVLAVATGALPAGLALEASSDGASWSITGAPSVAGAFAFSLSATDARGERDVASFALRVVPRAVRFVTLALPAAARGDRYQAVIETSARAPAQFSLAGGQLPPGLVLSRDGVVSGTVAADAPQRAWSFAVSVRDAAGADGLAAYAIDVPAPRATLPATESSGCSSTGSSSGLLFGAGLLALVLRRRRGVLLAATAVSLSLASPAQAYYRVLRATEPLVPLTGATTLLDTSGADFTETKTLPVAITFPFSFYGQQQTAAGVSTAGLLSFGSTLLATQSNTKIPTGGAPNAYVAPFWDALRLSSNTPGGASAISYKTEGTAPNRVLAIEWKNLQRALDAETGPGFASYTFQVRLHEGTGEITIRTAVNAGATTRPATLTGTVGIENLDGSAGLDLSDTRCSPACAAGSIVSNRLVRLVPSPDLAVEDLVAPGTLFVGAEASVRTLVRNVGGALAPAAGARVYLSQDTLLDDSDLLLVESPGVTVESGLTGGVTSRLRVPDDVQPGGWFLIARVTAGAEEVSEENNESRALPVVVSPAAPDLLATRLLAPSEAVAGRAFTYTRTVKNAGNAAGVADVLVVLSPNDFVTPADLVLESVSGVALAAGASLDGQQTVELPATLQPGRYWLGLIARPADGAAELDSLNNTRMLGPVVVRGGGLSIVGGALPSVVAGVPFSLQLEATGGVDAYVWSAGRPPPPEGVSVSADGRVFGVLESVTEASFEVRVASGGAVASRSVTLVVTGREEPLSVASARLPVGEVGAPYVARLKAVGGAPPYAWSLVEGASLPEGLRLAPDGLVEGVAVTDGTALVAVRVVDAKGASVSGEVRLPVAGQSRPVLSTVRLARAEVGRPYAARIDAAGGAEPYRFSVVESRRVPNGPGDVGRSLVGALPPGLALAEDGSLSGMPTEAGLFAVSLRVVDARAVDDSGTWLLEIGAEGGLAVRTAALPDATVGTEYAQQLVAEGGTPPLTWEAQLVEGAELPAGIIVTTDGRVVGFPSEPGLSAFMAVVRDAAGRVALRPLSVRVVEAPVEVAADSSGGCSQPGVLGLVALAGLLVLRRRRSLLALAGAAALSVGCVEAKDPATDPGRCATSCADPFVCDPSDGLCKCGGVGGAICGGGETCDAASKSCLVATCASGCPAGTACGIDGACHCGDGFGAVCAAGEACDGGRCVAQDVCAGVVCAAGMVCDPAASGQCRCGPGGPVCASGERCESGACETDLCLGVSCTGGTTCDPSDGRCRCGGQGGAVCASGESCNATLALCERSDRCEGVTCGAGSACDPSDGTCRCGGVGGPRCAADQSCDPVARACLGGDLCASASCGAGTSCDPEDGLCKCGGAGGVVCATGLACISVPGRDACATPCDVFGTPCAAGQQCEYDRASGGGYCRAEGTLEAGDECSLAETCGPRLHCDGDGDAATCRSYCTSDDGCRTGESCRPLRSGNALGVCVSTR